jgi:lipid-binding SYLF domain-containing protein
MSDVLMFAFIFFIGLAAGMFIGAAIEGTDLPKYDEAGYRRGQLDAHNGFYRYGMTTQPTGEVLWSKTDGK